MRSIADYSSLRTCWTECEVRGGRAVGVAGENESLGAQLKDL